MTVTNPAEIQVSPIFPVCGPPPPVVYNEDPADGATGIAQSAQVSFDVMDMGGGIEINATTITLGGVLAWELDAPTIGFVGTRTGYHYEIRRASGWLPNELVTVVAHVEDLTGDAASEGWSFTASSFTASSAFPPLTDESGGTLITISGVFPVGETFSVRLGPLLCYSGRQGYGRHPESFDGLTIVCVTTPAAVGVQALTVTRDSNQESATIAFTVVERHHQSKRLSTRACFPPWAGVGPRRIEED